MAKTIAAISTPLAPGGIGMVRISGDDAQKIADRVFCSRSGKKLEEIEGYKALYGMVRDENGEKIDEAIALNFRAPASFTGENVVELSCHGGIYLVKRVLAAVLAAGAVPAGPGEFTKRSFLNGKTDLAQAEAVMDLISAQGEQAARVALSGRDGVLSGRISEITDSLTDLGAHLSAWADYPDDDIPQVDEEMLKDRLNGAEAELSKLLSTFDTGKILREGVNTVIAGKPNAGKSTLMNLLAGCERSIVTSYAGTTRDVVEETILLGDIPLRLADTAGIRETEDPVESIGVSLAKERIRGAQLVLAVFDSSLPLTQEDKQLIEEIRGIPAICVVNKSDLETAADTNYLKSHFEQVVFLSALSGEGLEDLTTAAESILRTGEIDTSAGVLFTERQRDDARMALESVREAKNAMALGFTLDAVTVSVEGAIGALLELTGKRVSDTVVDSVFAKFCVGK